MEKPWVNWNQHNFKSVICSINNDLECLCEWVSVPGNYQRISVCISLCHCYFHSLSLRSIIHSFMFQNFKESIHKLLWWNSKWNNTKWWKYYQNFEFSIPRYVLIFLFYCIHIVFLSFSYSNSAIWIKWKRKKWRKWNGKSFIVHFAKYAQWQVLDWKH